MGYAKWLLRTVLKEGHWLVIDEVPILLLVYIVGWGYTYLNIRGYFCRMDEVPPFIFGLLVSGAYIYNKSAGIFFPRGHDWAVSQLTTT